LARVTGDLARAAVYGSFGVSPVDRWYCFLV